MTNDDLEEILKRVNPDSVATFMSTYSGLPNKTLPVAFQFLYMEILKNRRFMHQLALGRKVDGALLGREIESIELLIEEYAKSLAHTLEHWRP